MTPEEEKTYRALIAAGHSALKAQQILLDAKRGCPLAKTWIAIISQQQGESHGT